MKWFDHIIHTSERLNKIRSTQPCFPPVSLNRVPSSAGGKGGNVTSAGWQVIPYSMWVPVAITLVVNLQTAIYSIYLLTFIMIIYPISWFYRTTLCQCGICCRRVASVRPSVTSRYCIETMDESNWFLAWRLPSTCPTLCYKTWDLQKSGRFPLELCPKLRTWKISPRQVDRVVNKTRRRRRRRRRQSSLFTTPIR